MKKVILSIVLFFSVGILSAQPLPIPASPSIAAKSYILVDFNSGQVLEEKEAHKKVEPASITKLMTAYAVFTALKNNAISLDDEVLVSEKAWRMKGSRMFIEVGKKIKLTDLLKGMVVQSGNDASVALAEHVAGNEDNFVQYMNNLAQKLGMKNTHYVNATGWPAKDHYTTAYDIALLAAAMIRDFPEHYKLFSIKKFTFNKITQFNRNKLLWRDKTVDGMKTGHTKAAGYCLVSSAKRDNMRLISVVMGTRSEKARMKESQKLLNFGFRFFDSRKLYSKGEKIDQIKVWKGKEDQVDLKIDQDLYVLIPRGQEKNVKARMDVSASIEAPVKQGQKVGELVITLQDKEIARTPLLVAHNVQKGGFFKRAVDMVKMYFKES